MITVSSDNKVFHIQTAGSSYILRVTDKGHLSHCYFGKKIRQPKTMDNLFRPLPIPYGCSTSYSSEDPAYSLDYIGREEATPGKGDYRSPSLILKDGDRGDSVFDFIYETHSLSEGKPELPGLPSSLPGEDRDVETLMIRLKDLSRNVYLNLNYSCFPEAGVITRWGVLENRSGSPLVLDRFMSCSLDMDLQDMELISLNGAWIRERHIHRAPVTPGLTELGSRRGVSSSDHNPFFVLAAGNTDENAGGCYGFSLVYSGSHSCRIEQSPQNQLRVQMGIQDEGFRWLLNDGEDFHTPEGVLSFSDEGLSSLSRNFHRFVQNHIVRGYWQYKERPVLINNWEATYFDFNEKKLLALAKEAAAAGVELFVLDDGWFGKRNDDTTSLGDWFVDTKKLPGGLEGLQKKIKKAGLDFGLWVEPEMISEQSELYKAHPEWLVRSPRQTPSPGRNQFLLDLTNKEVRDYLIQVLGDVFSSAEISYVKWDMNRNFSDCFSSSLPADRQEEFAHRYVLGLYEILRALTEAFPKILFESCASGGNRFDLGMLCYMPQTWTSDDTDAVERLPIQYGTSFFAPPSTMGAHVSAVPNHQVLRETSLESRFNTAAFGVLGYELDMTKGSQFDKKVIRKQIKFYKAHRALFQFGEFRRIQGGPDSNEYLWMVISKEKDEAMAGWYQILARPNSYPRRLRFPGLLADRDYSVTNRIQYENIRRFGELVKEALPVDLKEGGFVLNKLADHYLYKLEEDSITAGGDFLESKGYLPRPGFYGSGMKEGITFVGDFGSRIYHIKGL
ncbi:MAG: alpha-galactosidase [Spirochaetales bacterium]|nr:alpha-galactosidase [Spirochaetales bacterium]